MIRVLGLVLMVYVGVVAFDAAIRPTRRRLALRNISRRRGEAVLVVLGAMLGTAIITSSFVVGDSVSASIVDVARTNFGPIDEVVRITGATSSDEMSSRLTDPPLPGTDGVIRAVGANAAAATIGSDRRAVDTTTLIEIDFDDARLFGGDPTPTGLIDAGPTPTGDQVVINERLARKLGVRRGDRIELFAYGSSVVLTVREVVPELGIAGFGFGSTAGQIATPVFVPDHTIERLASPGAAGGANRGSALTSQPPTGLILVSNTGGVIDGSDGSDSVEDAIKARLGDRKGVEVSKSKQGLLDAARRQGDSLTQLFGGIGYFSVAAGLLLLVNLFVMLSEERKSELGMLRALGFKRNQIMRTFSVEGAVYALAAAVLGGVVGIGVGAGIDRIAMSIFNSETDRAPQVLDVKVSSVVLGMAIGFLISMVTVFVTSLLISRLNIIVAIRDLPKQRHKRRFAWVVSGGFLVLTGVALTAGGINGHNVIAAIIGPASIAFGVTLVADRKPVTIVAAGFVVLWSATVYAILPDVAGRPSINTFVVEGLVVVGAAVTLAMQFDRLWSGVADLLAASGRGLSARLSMAYPLARRFRTGLLLGMFTLVIFTMTFLSAFSEIFSAQAPQFTREISAGFDLMMDVNPTNPVPIDSVRETEGVVDVVALVRGFTGRFTTKYRSDRPNILTGITDGFLRYGTPHLGKRASDFIDDQAAFRAVVHDPTLTIVPSTFLQGGGGPAVDALQPGDVVTVVNAANGEKRDLKIAGVVDREFLQNGALVGADFARSFLSPQAVDSRFYVKVAQGADAEKVAERLQGEFVPNGVHAETFVHRVTAALSQNQAFINLLKGYLGLGLLIGVAGLGVVMIRAVRERRRQIGMLRAMGFPARVVRSAFLLESSFLALQGIALGIALGTLTSYQLLSQSDSFGDTGVPYQVPVLSILVIFVVPFVGSLVATAAPANRAAKIKPAVALRIAD